jgi:hypothetical protein
LVAELNSQVDQNQCELLKAQDDYPFTRKGKLVFLKGGDAQKFFNHVRMVMKKENTLYHALLH